MEELLYTAIPTKSLTTILLLSAALVTLLIFLYLVETKKIKGMTHVYRQISFLLAALLSLIVLATTLFSIWNYQMIQPVKLYETYVESYHGKTFYKDIKRVGIFNDQEQSMINSKVTIREDNIMVIEKRKKGPGKHTLLFAEENYDIKVLVKKIQEQIKKNG